MCFGRTVASSRNICIMVKSLTVGRKKICAKITVGKYHGSTKNNWNVEHPNISQGKKKRQLNHSQIASIERKNNKTVISKPICLQKSSLDSVLSFSAAKKIPTLENFDSKYLKEFDNSVNSRTQKSVQNKTNSNGYACLDFSDDDEDEANEKCHPGGIQLKASSLSGFV
jgi:hypothetical protein